MIPLMVGIVSGRLTKRSESCNFQEVVGMSTSGLPDDVADGIERLVRDRWHEEKIDFTRSLGDQNHVFRTLARLNDFFDLGLSWGNRRERCSRTAPSTIVANWKPGTRPTGQRQSADPAGRTNEFPLPARDGSRTTRDPVDWEWACCSGEVDGAASFQCRPRPRGLSARRQYHHQWPPCSDR